MKICLKNKKSNICGKKGLGMPKGNLSLASLPVDWKSLGCEEGKGNATSVPHSRTPCPVGRQASEGERKEEYQVLYIPVGVLSVPSGRMNFCQPAMEA